MNSRAGTGPGVSKDPEWQLAVEHAVCPCSWVAPLVTTPSQEARAPETFEVEAEDRILVRNGRFFLPPWEEEEEENTSSRPSNCWWMCAFPIWCLSDTLAVHCELEAVVSVPKGFRVFAFDVVC